jgi:hypothetical protein
MPKRASEFSKMISPEQILLFTGTFPTFEEILSITGRLPGFDVPPGQGPLPLVQIFLSEKED